jgi:uncharacterized membrane protein YiaA
MKQPNRFIESMSLTCIVINIGLFFVGLLTEQYNLQLLSLFNVACFFLYFLILGKK